jgi:DNA-directed RNA polymerase subunit F
MPKVRKVLSSKPITIQAAHDLLSRFLQKEREDGVLGGVDEVLTRLEAVCHSLPTSETQETIDTELQTAKKAAKRKRRSEESSSRGSKKIKTR